MDLYKMKMSLMISLVFAISVGLSTGTQWYKVGDEAGWTASGHVDYKSWAETKTFKVGDTIQFVYNKDEHDVVRVTYHNYKTCNATSPYVMYDSGNDTITINNTGHFFFICSHPGHCEAGQKVDIRIPGPDCEPSPSPMPPSHQIPGPAPVPPPTQWSSPSPAPVPPPTQWPSPSPAPVSPPTPSTAPVSPPTTWSPPASSPAPESPPTASSPQHHHHSSPKPADAPTDLSGPAPSPNSSGALALGGGRMWFISVVLGLLHCKYWCFI